MRPEDALERAREEAGRRRAGGTYPPRAPGALEESIASEGSSDELLADWALVHADPELVYSTRRLGAPLTALKRLLLRLMRQYHQEVEARQTRFNIALLTRLRELERRVGQLERDRDG